jgi:hypothetical protein
LQLHQRVWLNACFFLPYAMFFSLHIVQDPYVEAIGGIEYNDESQAFVVSGYTE